MTYSENFRNELYSLIPKSDTLGTNSLASACAVNTRMVHLRAGMFFSRLSRTVLPQTPEVTCVATWLCSKTCVWKGWCLYGCSSDWVLLCHNVVYMGAVAHWVPLGLLWGDMKQILQLTHVGYEAWVRNNPLWWLNHTNLGDFCYCILIFPDWLIVGQIYIKLFVICII